jgi:hypothetical protein
MTTPEFKQNGIKEIKSKSPGVYNTENSRDQAKGEFVWIPKQVDDSLLSQDSKSIVIPSVENKKEKKLVLTARSLASPKKLKNKKNTRGVKALLPPPFDATTRTTIHRRFRANSAGTSTVISMGAIFGCLGVVGTVTNTTCVSMYSSFKLARITIWPPQNSGADRTILEWGASADGGYSPDSAYINTIPDGITETTGITFRPPAKSLLNNWMSTYLSASNIIAYMTCPVGTIIDLHVTACMPNDFVPESITVAAATVGSVYYLALDGPSTNNFIPVGLVSTH